MEPFEQGETLRQQGDFQGAVKSYLKVKEADPDYAAANYWLGMLAEKAGDFPVAERFLQCSINADPSKARPYAAMGMVQVLLGYPAAKAEASLKRAIERDPELFVAHSNLGVLYRREFLYPQALQSLQRAVELNGDILEPRVNLASLQSDMGYIDDAIATLREVIARWPGAGAPYNNLASILRSRGSEDEALEVLLEGTRRASDYAGNWYQLSLVHTFNVGDPLLDQLVSRAAAGQSNPTRQAALYFALGKARHDCGEYERSWQHYLRANAIMQAQPGGDAGLLNADRARQQDLASGLPEAVPGAQRAVLVLGMSRSGKSLLESRLGLLDGVQGVGERPWFWREAVRYVTQSSGAPEVGGQGLRALRASHLAGIGSRYLENLSAVFQGAAVLVNTSPGLVDHVGIMAHALPGLKVLHCRRDRRDAIFAIWRHNYTARNAFAFDLAAIARQYDAYEALVEHWRQRYPGLVHTVDYEALVTDPETTLASAMQHCGLAGDVSKLAQGIHDREVGQWRHYRQHLEHL
jgi:tetratricopeptide (TPR) repeat protein